MRRALLSLVSGSAIIALTLSDAAAQSGREGLIEEPIKIAATVFRSRVNFDALLIRPQGPGPFPLAVIAHGAVGDHTRRAATRAASLAAPAYEMARRGWVAVSFLRLGYGTTGGEPLDSPVASCSTAQYEDPALATAEQMRAAIEALRNQPFVDGQRIIALGVSAGGYGSLALATLPVEGLRAVVNFAGGRGSNEKGDVCSVSELSRVTGRFGSRGKVPALWIYAENDRWFIPAVVRTMYNSYTASGGKGQILFTGPSGDDGHGMMGRDRDVYMWAPTLDTFLRGNGLPTWSPETLKLESPRANEELTKYLAMAGEKAFALSPSGAYGWRGARGSTEEARRAALQNCAKDGARDCRLVFVNFERAR